LRRVDEPAPTDFEECRIPSSTSAACWVLEGAMKRDAGVMAEGMFRQEYL
jgi:hypothetical protein